MKIAVVQMNTQDNLEDNLRDASRFIENAAREGAELIVLPEYFAFLDLDTSRMWASGVVSYEQVHDQLSALAKANNVAIHAGSIVESVGGDHFNTTLVFDRLGQEICKYRKIHLFDVKSLTAGAFRESDMIKPGTELATYKLDGVTFGCSICYDLRFPELFRKLRDLGSDVIILPAAFTYETGEAHWETLLRARAIETQSYVVAAAQTQSFSQGKKQTWGHSVIFDPWGRVLAEASDAVETINAEIDPSVAAKIRDAMPVATHHVL